MQLKNTKFTELMQRRIFNVLIVANPYDAFMLEDDGRVDEKIFQEYARLGLSFPPRFVQVSTEEEAEQHLKKGEINLVICMPSKTVGDGDDVFDMARNIKTRYTAIPMVVLTPFSNKISISQKIKGSEERGRLRRLMQSIKPEGFGVIVRTVAEGKNVEELDADLRNLMSQWSTLTERLKTLTSPTKVLSELSTASALLRDVLTDDFNAIYVDNENVCNEIRQYIATVAPDKADIVHPYKMETPTRHVLVQVRVRVQKKLCKNT